MIMYFMVRLGEGLTNSCYDHLVREGRSSHWLMLSNCTCLDELQPGIVLEEEEGAATIILPLPFAQGIVKTPDL